jgi:hypothetical protein
MDDDIRQWAEQHPEQWAELERRHGPAARRARQLAQAQEAVEVPLAAPLPQVDISPLPPIPPLLPEGLTALAAVGRRPPPALAKIDDTTLLVEGRSLMDTQGIAAWDAAGRLAPRSKGEGSEDSRRRRLWRVLRRHAKGAM